MSKGFYRGHAEVVPGPADADYQAGFDAAIAAAIDYLEGERLAVSAVSLRKAWDEGRLLSIVPAPDDGVRHRHDQSVLEFTPGLPKMDREQARTAGFTGNQCPDCGSFQMVRNGTCEKCNTCGATTGCS